MRAIRAATPRQCARPVTIQAISDAARSLRIWQTVERSRSPGGGVLEKLCLDSQLDARSTTQRDVGIRRRRNWKIAKVRPTPDRGSRSCGMPSSSSACSQRNHGRFLSHAARCAVRSPRNGRGREIVVTAFRIRREPAILPPRFCPFMPTKTTACHANRDWSTASTTNLKSA